MLSSLLLAGAFWAGDRLGCWRTALDLCTRETP